MGRDLGKLIKKYAGLWIAFKPETNLVVASGKDLKTVVNGAKEKGIKIPVVFKVPMENIPFIG